MKDKNEMALLRFSIIAPIVNGTYEESSIRKFAQEASKRSYDFDGKKVKYSEATIKRWYHNYRKHGYDGLVNLQRGDYKAPRKLNADAKTSIEKLAGQYPRMSATAMHDKLLREHIIEHGEVSIKTVQRYVKMLRGKAVIGETERRRFRAAEPNGMWQSDTSTGPYILVDGKKYRTYLILFLDDHSRLITGHGFFFRDTAINMQKVFKEAVKVYGVPKVLYVDNGGPYVNQQLKIICARIGTQHKNTRAYDPQSKGKIERAFRTIKAQWMNTINWNDFKSVDDVNESFGKYVRVYNNTVHSAIGKSPNDAFHEYGSIRKIEPEKIDRMFWHEIRRTADSTSCISVERRKYEVPSTCIGAECIFTYDPEKPEKIYFEGTPCKLLNDVANSRKKRRVNISYIGVVNAEDDVIEAGDEDEIS